MMELGFIYPYHLHLFLLVPVLVFFYFLFYSYHKRKSIPFANFLAVQKIAKKYGKTRYIPLLIIRIISLSLIILALAGTYLIIETETTRYDMVVAIDTSSSMLADDVSPNRLESAKLIAKNFVERLDAGSRIGITSFSSTSHIRQTLTESKKNLVTAIENIKITKHSTADISQGIVTSTNMLTDTNQTRLILLLTDGHHNIGNELEDSVNYAVENEVRILPVAVGTKEGGFVQGINMSFRIDTKNLEFIANQTGTEMVHIKKEVETTNFLELGKERVHKIKKPINDYLLYALLGILLIEFVLVKTIYKITP